MCNLLKILLLTSISLILVACYTSPYTESTGEYLDSSAITARVKASLLNELGSSGFAIVVKTYKDEVQLSGFVDNLGVRSRAAIIATGVDGVRGVRNDLIVKKR